MNFFAAQDQARRSSRRLVIAYVVATAAIVAGVTAIVGAAIYFYSQTTMPLSPGQFMQTQWPLLATAAVATTVFILGASLFKTAVLSAGGGKVAKQMGGTLIPTDVQDPLRRRLRNVVEEMAIASGVPVPEIYVLEEEAGINAFAAGFSTSDAAVAVTRGTLELLDRDELQGVIAHEFSHILNGDMKLNVRLMGVLFGIMVLGLIGRMIVRGGYHTGLVSSQRSRGHPAVFAVGIGLIVLGGIGVFFARAIKASVSRQREYLADASAVQFTRQSTGIANALKKIGGYKAGSTISATDPEEVSHMLFGSGAALSGLFATHPPLIERIRALDPAFDENYPVVNRRERRIPTADDAAHAAFAGDITTAFASGGTKVLASSIPETVGKPAAAHVEYAKSLRRSIPADLYDAAHSAELAFLLAITLVLDRSDRVLERQLSLLQEQLGSERTAVIRRFQAALAETDGEYRLPLLEILFPALKLRPAPELGYLVELTTKLIEIDGDIELYEFCFYRIMLSSLNQAINPTGQRRVRRVAREKLRQAALDLLRVLAEYGHDSDERRRAAFRDGIGKLGSWAAEQQYRPLDEAVVLTLNRSLDCLLGLNSKGQEVLLRAISATAAHDGRLSTEEAELIRAVCATLNYPLPPILVERDLPTH